MVYHIKSACKSSCAMARLCCCPSLGKLTTPGTLKVAMTPPLSVAMTSRCCIRGGGLRRRGERDLDLERELLDLPWRITGGMDIMPVIGEPAIATACIIGRGSLTHKCHEEIRGGVMESDGVTVSSVNVAFFQNYAQGIRLVRE